MAKAYRGPSEEVEITIYRGHAFAKAVSGDRPFGAIVEQEVELVTACLEEAPLYVDVPIDLQGLPCPRDNVFAWQLVKRPVDRASGALPPLADRIGSVVARFSNILRDYRRSHPEPLGRGLYETYPAGSLRLLKWPHKGYKEKDKRTTFREGRWVGQGAKSTKLAEIAGRLGLTAEPDEELDHDELDAVICSLTGILDDNCLLQEGDLQGVISKQLGNPEVSSTPPEGYVLLKEYPPDLKIKLEKTTVNSHSAMLEAVRR